MLLVLAALLVGIAHGLFAAMMFALGIDQRSRDNRARQLRKFVYWWPFTAAVQFLVTMLMSAPAAWTFLGCSVLTFGVLGLLVYLGRPRALRQLPSSALAAWPLQPFFESPLTKGFGVLVCGTSALVAYAWSAGFGTALCVVGTFLWGGADIYAGARSFAKHLIDGA